MKEKIIIYGTGKKSQNYMKIDYDENMFEIVAFADGESSKHGGSFWGKPIVAPVDILSYEFDKLLIASTFFDEIFANLTLRYGIPKDKISNIYYGQSDMLKKRYEAHYDKNRLLKNKKPENAVLAGERIAVYTAITNGYDDLREPKIISNDCDYICFTDDTSLQSKVWDIRKMEIIENEPVRSARRYKMLPHLYLPEYTWSIYIDGKFGIEKDIRKLIEKYAGNSSMSAFLHYCRETVLKEAEACICLNNDSAELIASQMIQYEKEGFPDDSALIETGILIRRHNESHLISVMDTWWHEIETKSRRDQLSFNYAAWKNNFIFDIMDLNIYDNEYLRYYPHNK